MGVLGCFVGVLGAFRRFFVGALGVFVGGFGDLCVFCVCVLKGVCGYFLWAPGGLLRGVSKAYDPRNWDRVGSAGIGRVRHRVAIWRNILIDPPNFGRKLRKHT